MQRLKVLRRRVARKVRQLRRRGRTGLTLVLWAPHPAQGDLHRALRSVASAMRSDGPLVHSERPIPRLTSDRLRELMATADAQHRPLIVESALLPETQLHPFAESAIRDVRSVLARTTANRVTIVVMTAPPDRVLEAVYIRRAEHGVAGPFDKYLARFDAVDLSYASLIDGLAALPQVQTVVPVSWTPAEKSLATTVSQVLTAAMGSAPEGLLKPFERPARVRGYASRRGVLVAKAMHDFVETGKERRLVRKMVRQNFPARRLNDVTYLSEEDRQRLRARYRDDRRALKSAGTS